MDSDLLQKLFSNLDSYEQSISSVAQYCSTHYKQSKEIVNLYIEILRQARKDKKIYFFYACHEIIQESKKKFGFYFIKSFGPHLKEILQLVCKSIDSFENIKKILIIVEKWMTDQTYHPSFCEKLKLIIGPFYKELNQQYEKYYGEKDQKGKYTKTFLVNYQIVNENDLTADIYKTVVSNVQTTQKLDKFNYICDQILKRNSKFTDVKEKEELDDIINQSKEYKEDLIKIIEENQNLYKYISEQCQNELKNYTEFNQEVVEYYQSKYKYVS